ncbi:TetR/AcrR family transcriptional regulator [Kitasatospora aureofaciens]|uniref:TetR family transcriptional regulator n=1 Tax=Kitasatospora aureofaciens TaxID=1894 RepID=A0A1E7N602_KITAU|nr:TetR/AcrR family transcriptional regulator [Kitasatospora aureofaciens]ARF80067.1 TetR family transcriptional regulator [Kitasatospora aureofaciens]OEV36121.1 TetR family transcriptional regulator [Kitasatospora aureofaciens]GGV02753.1 TetR family transcriptional regulator [Kitasatospora aureofaciens]
MASRTAPDPARRSERARAAVLTAAAELVAEVGYGKLTIEAIAARAGVGKQTIYRWWPSKGAVVFDAFLAVNQHEGGLALPDTGDLAADLRAVLRPTSDELTDPRADRTYRAIIAELLNDPVLHSEYRTRLLDPLLEVTRDRLRAAREAGQLAPDADLDLAVELVYGPLYYRWQYRLGPLTHEHADRLVDAALRALNHPAASGTSDA